MVGDLLQDDEAGQDQAHRAPQPRVGLLAAVGPVALAVLHQTELCRATTHAAATAQEGEINLKVQDVQHAGRTTIVKPFVKQSSFSARMRGRPVAQK